MKKTIMRDGLLPVHLEKESRGTSLRCGAGTIYLEAEQAQELADFINKPLIEVGQEWGAGSHPYGVRVVAVDDTSVTYTWQSTYTRDIGDFLCTFEQKGEENA